VTPHAIEVLAGSRLNASWRDAEAQVVLTEASLNIANNSNRKLVFFAADLPLRGLLGV
jgi:hypothetical protein